jgi:hypothetical protein
MWHERHRGWSRMRYYFSLINGRTFDDVDGLEMPDLAAARAEAIGFAKDMMRLEPEQNWLKSSVRVTDEEHNRVFDLPFAEI